MARTTEARVKAVLAPGNDYDLEGRPSLEEFIAVGTTKVDQLVADCATYGITVPSDSVLATLETWVSAWAYKNSDQQEASGNAGRSSSSTKGQTGMGLESNHYGQTAIELDPTGLLQVKQKGVTATGAWTGRRKSAQTPYSQRN
jgi:hypothetical protein